MTAANFERALDLVLRHEGGYVDNPHDPGGATNMGITLGTLRGWRGEIVSKGDVRNLTRKEAGEIYRTRYWNKMRCDDLPGGLDYCCFDAAVNSGPVRSARWLQQAVFATADGMVGPQTIAAANGADAPWSIRRMARIRLDFLKQLPHWPTFGRGWQRRVEEMERHALILAGNGPEIHQLDPPAPPAGFSYGGTKMDDIKSFIASRTVWAAVIGFAAVVANALGLSFGVEQTEIVDAIIKVVEGVSFLAAIVFRIAATSRLA